MSKETINCLAHISWNCKYHIVFAPKYRRKIFFNQKRREIGAILRSLCKWKEVEIIEVEIFPEHVHMLRLNTTKTNSEWIYGIFKSEK